MTIQIKHAFTSAKGDGGDATLVRPSNWNAAHTTTMATLNLVGRLTAGPGAFEEIPISAFIAAALSAADGPAFLAALGVGGFKTGDVKFSVSNVADSGWWVPPSAAATIGKVGSGASLASAAAQPLYELIWGSIADTYCPVSGGRGGSAAADFAAGKTIASPWFTGRSIVGAGGGGVLSTRVLGAYAGAETHTLVTAELASHYHSAGIYDPGHAHSVYASVNGSVVGVQGGGTYFFAIGASPVSFNTGSAATGVRVNSSNGLDTTYSAGSGNAHNNMHPYIPMWVHLKL